MVIILLLLLLTVNNFIKGKWHSLTALYKDDIAVYTWDHSFLNFLRCISQSSRIKQTRKLSFFEKQKWKANYV